MALIPADDFFPFDSGAGSTVSENGWARLLNPTQPWGSGVVPDYSSELEVTADSGGRQVYVDTGEAWVAGHSGRLTSSDTVPISANPTLATRIDVIVWEVNLTTNNAGVNVVEGTVDDTEADIEWSASVLHIPLAEVRVSLDAATIAPADVTDRRAFCGWPPQFANADARSYAVGAGSSLTRWPGQLCWLRDPGELQVYNGSAWVAV